MDELIAQIRSKETHHDARKTRKVGNVPGILYGKGFQNLMFEIGQTVKGICSITKRLTNSSSSRQRTP